MKYNRPHSTASCGTMAKDWELASKWISSPIDGIGCRAITNFPSDRLISCGLPGCEVF